MWPATARVFLADSACATVPALLCSHSAVYWTAACGCGRGRSLSRRQVCQLGLCCFPHRVALQALHQSINQLFVGLDQTDDVGRAKVKIAAAGLLLLLVVLFWQELVFWGGLAALAAVVFVLHQL